MTTPVGKTPLAASLALPAGNHAGIEARRPGYVTAKQSVTLGAGSIGELELEPPLDASSLTREGGYLALAVSEPESTTFVDGEPRGVYTTPLHVSGPHPSQDEHPAKRTVVQQPASRPAPVAGRARRLLPVRAHRRRPARQHEQRQGRAHADPGGAGRVPSSRTVTQRTWGWIATGTGRRAHRRAASPT